jgi:mannose/fructose/N-acetylgalactosamine-specific phosphotransferase system component IID
MNQYSLKSFKQGLSPEEIKALAGLAWRSNVAGLNYCRSRMMGNSFHFVLMPFIAWLYPKKEDKERKLMALARTRGFWNCEQTTTAFAMSIIAGMEQQASKDENFNTASIQTVKSSLMGPLSVIGDTFFWVIWRVIAICISMSFAVQGSFLGPILFITLYNLPKVYARHYFTFLGYKQGMKFLDFASKTGILQHIITSATLICLFMMGGMVASYVNTQPALTFQNISGVLSFVEISNNFFKSILDAGIVLLFMLLIKKKIKPSTIMFSVIAICIFGKWVGII